MQALRKVKQPQFVPRDLQRAVHTHLRGVGGVGESEDTTLLKCSVLHCHFWFKKTASTCSHAPEGCRGIRRGGSKDVLRQPHQLQRAAITKARFLHSKVKMN